MCVFWTVCHRRCSIKKYCIVKGLITQIRNSSYSNWSLGALSSTTKEACKSPTLGATLDGQWAVGRHSSNGCCHYKQQFMVSLLHNIRNGSCSYSIVGAWIKNNCMVILIVKEFSALGSTDVSERFMMPCGCLSK